MLSKKRTGAKPADKDLAPATDVTPHVPPASAAEGKALTRDSKGRFLKGVKTGGRELGSKNRITNERNALEAALREYMNKPERKKKMFAAIDHLLDLSVSENDDKIAIGAMKVLFDKVLATAKQPDDATQQEQPKVQIIIENHTTGQDVTPPKVIIDQIEE